MFSNPRDPHKPNRRTAEATFEEWSNLLKDFTDLVPSDELFRVRWNENYGAAFLDHETGDGLVQLISLFRARHGLCLIHGLPTEKNDIEYGRVLQLIALESRAMSTRDLSLLVIKYPEFIVEEAKKIVVKKE